MKPSSSKPIAVVVIGFIGVFALLALAATWDLIRYLLSHVGKGIDPAAVGFIATMSGLCGTALGFIGGSLVQTEKAPSQNVTTDTANIQADTANVTTP
jgi:hypothetical protein